MLSLLLAFNVLIGSVGVPVSRHFCGGELKSVAIFGTAKSCHVEKVASCPSHPKEGSEVKRKNCCGDEFDYVQLDEDREVETSGDLPLSSIASPDLPLCLFPELATTTRPRKLSKLESYRPPPLLVDVMRQWQVYLI
ncbi:HYC_CC_PP family protein [Neolewinella agarilytica]|uniref:Secreted protein n=1 Tax=Neolewinella agarilytica TaxID=478744 RepID=A0A1H9H5U8_9BACT|nr:hypothetical protein SAMN05444359_11227 [Neolewinella agarilytica]|tara:strand:- start:175 stop:585 length:411 start_codon:yes stop_codon:yes gene_type:complete